MTEPQDRSHFYTDIVGEALDDYARSQLAATSQGFRETLRLWAELYEAADGDEAELGSKWLELWSAAVHFSAATAANFGVLIPALGAPRKIGSTDGLRPSREIMIPGATKPRCLAFRRLGATVPDGQGKDTLDQLSPSLVTFDRTAGTSGTDAWTVTFDLSSSPQRGTYYAQISPTGGLGQPSAMIDYYEYLDPTP